MRKEYIILLLLLAICMMVYATDPWGEPVILYGSMTVMAQVSIDGAPAASGDVLAAFVRTDRVLQLRGKANITTVDGVAGCLLQIFTESNGERVFFMVWDDSTHLLCDPMQHLYSEINSIVGSYPDNLYQINAISPGIADDPWPAPLILPESMTLMTQVNIYDSPASSLDVLAAFVTVNNEEQLRGKANLMVVDGVAGCLLQIFTVSAGEVIHFKVWHYSAQQSITCSNLLASQPDADIGGYPDNMYFINPGGAVQQIGELDFSPAAGVYGLSPPISISCSTADVNIHYTTDGSRPSSSSALYTAPITLPEAATTTLKAKAFKNGSYPSLIRSAIYQVNGRVPTPILSLASGTYTSATQVMISCAASAAQIRYTTDGSDPTQASSLYDTSLILPLDSHTTIKARAYLLDYEPSHIATASYTITGTVDRPAFTPGEGSYAEPVSVSISCSTIGAQIRYTTNNLEPSQTSALYDLPLQISSSCILKAKAFKTHWLPSLTAAAAYTISNDVSTPTFSPPAGEYDKEISVEIFCQTPQSEIYYTLDGSDPTQASILYSAPIGIADSTLVSARAYCQGFSPSAIATALYILPVSNPAAYQVPALCGIKAAYPNPCRGQLTISLQIKDFHQNYEFKIYNMRGVCVYSSSGTGKGSFDLVWDARDADHNKLPCGVYLLRLLAQDLQATRRVILY